MLDLHFAFAMAPFMARSPNRHLTTLVHDLHHVAQAKRIICDRIITPPRPRAKKSESLTALLRYYLDEIRRLFTNYTHRNCAACIKMLRKPERTVNTLVRDTGSLTDRNYLDTKYPRYSYNSNTIFETILREKNVFMCNELSRLACYKRVYDDWHKHYTAVLVAPIAESQDITFETTIGFLCVDNHGGGFDKPFCAPVISILATDLYQILRLFEISPALRLGHTHVPPHWSLDT